MMFEMKISDKIQQNYQDNSLPDEIKNFYNDVGLCRVDAKPIQFEKISSMYIKGNERGSCFSHSETQDINYTYKPDKSKMDELINIIDTMTDKKALVQECYQYAYNESENFKNINHLPVLCGNLMSRNDLHMYRASYKGKNNVDKNVNIFPIEEKDIPQVLLARIIFKGKQSRSPKIFLYKNQLGQDCFGIKWIPDSSDIFHTEYFDKKYQMYRNESIKYSFEKISNLEKKDPRRIKCANIRLNMLALNSLYCHNDSYPMNTNFKVDCKNRIFPVDIKYSDYFIFLGVLNNILLSIDFCNGIFSFSKENKKELINKIESFKSSSAFITNDSEVFFKQNFFIPFIESIRRMNKISKELDHIKDREGVPPFIKTLKKLLDIRLKFFTLYEDKVEFKFDKNFHHTINLSSLEEIQNVLKYNEDIIDAKDFEESLSDRKSIYLKNNIKTLKSIRSDNIALYKEKISNCIKSVPNLFIRLKNMCCGTAS